MNYKAYKVISSIVVSVVLLLGAGCVPWNYTVDLSGLTNGNAPVVDKAIRYPNWVTLTPDMQFKQLTLKNIDNSNELFNILKFSSTVHPVRLAIDSEHPKTIKQWQLELNAVAVINAGYFDENNDPTTRHVIDKKNYGPALTGNTGFAYTTNNKQWQIISTQTEVLTQAIWGVQAYPLLLNNNQIAFAKGSDNIAQRTVIALDNQNQVYFITTEYGMLSLNQLADLLKNQTGLALQTALNLDGGTSTGLAINIEALTYLEDSAPVPVVLYIQA
ncbi:MAG: phosphodiester glycosidase family protein [Patescibacteria group bacterium]|jgi:hypothetical protein